MSHRHSSVQLRRPSISSTTSRKKPFRQSTSNLPPLPLRPVRQSDSNNITNISQLPPQQKRRSMKRLSTTVDNARPKKTRRRGPKPVSYKQIDISLVEEQRLQQLVELLMKQEYEKKYASAPEEERQQFEKGMLQASNYLSKFVPEMIDSDECVSKKTRPNPMNDEMRKRNAQLEEVANNYELEFAKWESVEQDASSLQSIAPPLPTAEDAENLEGLPDPEKLVQSSREAIENYILQTDHMWTQLKVLQKRNRETHSKVQAMASALNKEVMQEFGSKTEDDDLAPPPNLVAIKVDGSEF